MAYAQGTGESVLIGFESSFKTMPGTPTGEKIPVTNPSIQPSRNKFVAQALTGSAEPRPPVFGKIGDDGDLGIECNPASLAVGCKGLFGTPVIGGLTLYNLRYTLGALLPMYIEDRHSDINQFFLYNGCYFGSTQWTFAAEGIMEARFRIMGARQTIAGTTAITGAITDRTGYDPFSYLLCRIKQGGTTLGYSQQVELNIDRKLGNAIAQDQTNERAVIFSEVAEITGKLTALFQDAVLANLALVGTETSLEIWVPGLTGYGLLIELPTIKFHPPQKQTNGTGLVTVAMDFDVYGKVGVSKLPGRASGGYLNSAAFPALNTLTLVIAPDGAANQTITFTATESTLDAVVTKINATLTGAIASADRAAGDTGGVLRIESLTKGTGSSINIRTSSTAAVLLGFDTEVVHAGLDGKSIAVTIFSPLNT